MYGTAPQRSRISAGTLHLWCTVLPWMVAQGQSTKVQAPNTQFIWQVRRLTVISELFIDNCQVSFTEGYFKGWQW
ncbi:hypothetical protein EV361DRAFT_929874 [Lentinula raphanica]|uniref:Secreted protein n=1 Tax=Lentinula raphanica TaxID=153919 RepID=A0AA38PKP9_9AGAR|nr:hypothetical protein F5880DRAFT_1517692 [Lentinula raphanica]KAJ3844728.1 hypothetical protein F5878DRAFT_601366 [Lentinula raphanica]KAJ3967581.1 hypothetical protein EV361DRAFT_929874 [Lentinula raphanica]